MSGNPKRSSTIPRPAVNRWLMERLDEVRANGTGQILAVRGRRQVGKSTAVERFVEQSGVPYVYVTGLYRMPERAQLDAAAAAFSASRRPPPGWVAGSVDSWREWLTQLALSAADGPVVAVLDEFPWLAGGDLAELEGVLQAVWDRVLEKLPVVLVLVGSDLAMMERIARHDRPLFGRVRELVVPAFDPAEVGTALAGLSPFETFDAYLVTGGYPRLVANLRASGQSMSKWVQASVADDLSPLVATGRLMIEAEFPDSAAVYRVLSAVGSAEPAQLGLGEIAAEIADLSASPKAVQTQALRTLELLVEHKRVIERDLPAWATSTRLRRYRLSDPYLRFWFRYVARHVDAIARGRGDVAFATFRRDWPSWRGRAIEPVVRQALERLAIHDGRLADIESIRPWWTRDGQVEVDVAGTGRDRTLMLGTVKWGEDRSVNAREIEELAAMRARVPRSAMAALAAISPTGAAPASADISFSAADLLGAWRPTEQ